MRDKHNRKGSDERSPPTGGAPGIEFLARGLLVVNGRVLLCRNVDGGYRYLPGGHVEPGESAAAALAREFLEESGVEVRVGGLILASEHGFVQGGRRRHEINLVFHVEHGEGSFLDYWPSLEPDIAFDWVALADLGSADLRPVSLSDRLFACVKAGKLEERGDNGDRGGRCGWLSDMAG